MNKEMLEQAVLDYIGEKFKDKVIGKRLQTLFTYSELVDTVLSFAELLNKNIEGLEKENRILGERCNQLPKDKGELIDKNRELKEQIEKMRCCNNCDNNEKDDWYNDNFVNKDCEGCENYCNWKLKED